jgi:hypothetical protein
MRPIALTLFALGPLVLCPPTADAGQLRMEFRNGTVSISADDVPLSQVLSEWARLGQTRIVNLEKLGGAPVTVELTNVPEKQALEVLLRNVPGYLAAARAEPTAGGSQFDRIVVMPGTIPPAQPAMGAAVPPPQPPPVPQAPIPPMGGIVEDQDQPVQDAAEQPVPAEEQQPQLLAQPGIQPGPPVAAGQPGDGEEQQEAQQQQQQQRGPGAAPVQGVIIAPQPGQLPVPPRKPPEQ